MTTTDDAEPPRAAEVFDWQTEPEGVLRWALPTLLADVRGDALDDLSARTNGFRAVELRVFVNDVELPARPLLEGLVAQLDPEVERRVAAQLRRVAGLETLTLQVEALERALAGWVRDAARELDLPLDLLEEDR